MVAPLVRFTNSHIKPPSLRFGVERVLWTSKRNGERAGTERITNGSEQGDLVPTGVPLRSRGGGFCEAKDGGSQPALKGEVSMSVSELTEGL